MPLAKAGDAKVSSSYSVDVEKTKNGLEGSLPDYVKRCVSFFLSVWLNLLGRVLLSVRRN